MDMAEISPLSEDALAFNFDQRDIESAHHVKMVVEDSMVCYVLTGVLVANDIKGLDQHWLRERIAVNIQIPELPEGMGLHIHQWAPYFTMNSVYNKDTAVNSGHAVDGFALAWREVDTNFGQDIVRFFIDVAISERDAYLLRIGYNITIKGTLKPLRSIS